MGQSLCPSVDPSSKDARLFRVGGDYLERPIAVPSGVSPEVVRCAAPCIEGSCANFSGDHCGLGRRILARMEPVVASLPLCSIRAGCRWFAEQGREVCLRCLGVAREQPQPTALQREVALGPRRFLPLLVQTW